MTPAMDTMTYASAAEVTRTVANSRLNRYRRIKEAEFARLNLSMLRPVNDIGLQVKHAPCPQIPSRMRFLEGWFYWPYGVAGVAYHKA